MVSFQDAPDKILNMTKEQNFVLLVLQLAYTYGALKDNSRNVCATLCTCFKMTVRLKNSGISLFAVNCAKNHNFKQFICIKTNLVSVNQTKPITSLSLSRVLQSREWFFCFKNHPGHVHNIDHQYKQYKIPNLLQHNPFVPTSTLQRTALVIGSKIMM